MLIITYAIHSIKPFFSVMMHLHPTIQQVFFYYNINFVARSQYYQLVVVASRRLESLNVNIGYLYFATATPP